MHLLKTVQPTAGRDYRHIFWSWLGGAVAIGLLGALTGYTNVPLLMAPFGASCVLVFGLPESPLAQPRNVIGGHTLTALTGFIFLYLFGDGWWAIGLAVGTAIALMQLTRTTHPPAGANPILVMLSAPTASFLLFPVLSGALLVVFVGILVNNISTTRSYPLKKG
ncbi:HPP family protein [Emcibacter nanhaiensis]|uniref:HPP family protein n=1 Tax=Emcibacter nanhaiensis TaxID=1505037 RepID=A0A501PHG6_9PROT|nr:HPP family protein [Emcibacter nanhaiensis]TPD59461.1 HPP family protein [Emcibacter nanhaiensis]